MLNILFGISFTLNLVIAIGCFILYKTKIKPMKDMFNDDDSNNIFKIDSKFWNDINKDDVENEK